MKTGPEKDNLARCLKQRWRRHTQTRQLPGANPVSQASCADGSGVR